MKEVVKEPFSVILKRFLETMPIYTCVSYSKDIEIVMGYGSFTQSFSFGIHHSGLLVCQYEIKNTPDLDVDGIFDIVTFNLHKKMKEYTEKVLQANTLAEELLSDPSLENTWTRPYPTKKGD